jgi:hypothetical protein
MTISFSQQWGLLYILMDLCMVMSFLINKKIDDGFFDWYQKNLQWDFLEGK